MTYLNNSMSARVSKTFVLLFALLFTASLAFGATEKIVTSRSGIAPLSPIVTNGSMNIQDQWYSFMQTHPVGGMNPWTNTFIVPDASNGLYDAWTNVVLRFDDSRLHYYAQDWDFTVTYDITTYSFDPSTGNGINSGVLSGSLTINHTNSGTYQDKSLMRYPNAFRAVLTITSCTLTVHTSPLVTVTYGSLPAEYNDIYLDLEQETQRNFVIASSPVCGPPVITNHNEFRVDWGFVQGAESYDVEWLFIDEPIQNLTTASLPYDFRNATRVNTPNQFYNIPLVYPRGILLYRVRGVSHDPTDPTLWVTGAWSFPYETGLTNDANTQPGTLSYRFRKEFNGLLPEMNWQYSASYAEDGKRVEMMTFYDGTLRSRQAQTIRNTDTNLIIGETKYDYDGRGVVQIIPVPLSDHDGLTFYPDFNPNFDRSNFALDATIDNPGALSTVSGAGNYYSTSNPNAIGLVAYVPDAQGYAYSETRITTDGTGRIRSQSIPGPDHKLGSDRETKFFYGSPTSQDEVDQLFGNEVGEVSHYQKNMVVDANGQVAVSYLDQEGRVIATSLAGNVPTNLVALDGRPADVTHTNEDLLMGRNHINNDNSAMVSSTALVCTAENTNYNFTYNLNSDTTCSNCFVCKNCMYDLIITIVDQDGVAVPVSITSQTCSTTVTGNPITCYGISSGNYVFTANLDIGTYTVTKTLRLSEASLQTYATEYTQYQLDGLGCVQPQPIHPEPCGYDCQSMCYQQYTIILDDGTTQYVDGNGEPLDAGDPTDLATWQGLISACTTACGATATTNPDPCTLKRNLLILDMSPGGQYFDNTPEQYTYDASGNLINNTNYNSNEWTTTNIWLDNNTTAWQNANFLDPANNLIDSWNEMRQYWQQGWATQSFNTAVNGHNSLLEYHPEYCAYNHYCGEVECDPNRLLQMSSSNNFDEDMYSLTDNTSAATAGYFNPTGVSGTETDLGAGGDNIGYINDDYDEVSGGDPYFNCETVVPNCGQQTLLGQMNDYLTHFLPVTISSTTYYYSIWYVLDDPDDIHTNGTSTGAPQDVVDYFQALHGGGSGTPLIGTGPGQITKYEYFRSVYMYYKTLLQYATLPATCSGTPLTDSDHNGFTDATFDGPMPGFQIRYPENPLYEAWINASPSMICGHDQSGLATAIDNMNDDMVAAQCSTNCEANADMWIAQISSCSLGTQEANIRQYLIAVCELNCGAENTEGGPGCTTCPTTPCSPATSCTGVPCVGCNPAATFYDFEDVVTYFTSGTCNEPISYNQDNSGSCSCNNFDQYLVNNNLTTSTDAAIASFINSDPATGVTTVTSTDVANWKTMCGSTNPSNSAFGANFPPSWLCSDLDDISDADDYNQTTCTCENIHNVINMLGFDPADANDYDAITAGLNAYLDPTTPITELNWLAWLAECESSNPSMTDLQSNNLPSILACPSAASSDPNDIYDAQENAACMQSSLISALANSIMIFHQQLEDELNPMSVNGYLAYTRQNCLNNLAGRESFTVTYTSNEFLYTLYYYDQAGNLVKTVPPQGVKPLDAAGIDDAQDYRNGVTGSSYTVPAHNMVTHYKYNSLQQVTYTETPDGGSTDIFYDRLGRVVASQSDKQASYTTPASYSYTLYDNLGRPYESGELKQAIALTDDIARDKDPALTLSTWLGVGAANKWQVTQSYYDAPMSSNVPGFGTSQENLRGRVSSVVHYNGSLNASNYSNAYHYSYDIHGSVRALSDENTSLANLDEDVKLTTYEYDFIAGNVNAVHYQSGYDDEFHHRYQYDADNRLVAAYSSRDQVIWEKEVKYFYYPTGSMARSEIGDRQVQATDYVLNINSWIKGVNSETRDGLRDVGKDGTWNSGAGQNGYFAQDAYGYTLKYYDGDYKPVAASASNFEADLTPGGNPYHDHYYYELFNGNIAAMVTALTDENENQLAVMGRSFRYDQLNRIKRVDAFTDANILTDNDWSSATHTWDYYESFSYDFNGNILWAVRNGISSIAQQMDSLEYIYTNMAPAPPQTTPDDNNKLVYVIDHATCAAGDYGIDIDNNQSAGNYTYELNGNLQKDPSEQIDRIDWTPQGKVWKVTRQTGSTKADLEFVYDPMGNRIEKIVKPRTSGLPTNQVEWTHTYYRRDASGNVLAVYSRSFDPGTGDYVDHYAPIEQHIYGSSRLGIRQDHTAATNITFTALGYDAEGYFATTSYPVITHTPHDLSVVTEYNRALGYKEYELTNHLGNVLETVSDRKLSTAQTQVLTSDFASGTGGWTAYGASVTWDSPNQRLKVDATAAGDGTTHAVTTVRGTHYTLSFSVDITNFSIDATAYDNSSNVLVSRDNISSDGIYSLEFTAVDNNTTVMFSSHVNPPIGNNNIFYIDNVSVGNTMLVENYLADVLRYSDYYAFGQQMPGRSGGVNYRYGFNGKEQDDETNTYDYGFRIYNPSLGKFLSLDPLTASYPELTPYQFASNTPIWAIDLDGLEAVPANEVWDLNSSPYISASSVYGNYDKSAPYKVVYYGNEVITLHEIISGPNAGNYMGIVHYGNYGNFWRDPSRRDEGYMWEEKYVFGKDRVPAAAFSRTDDLNIAVGGWIFDPENWSPTLCFVGWAHSWGKGYFDQTTGEWVDQSSASDMWDGYLEIISDPYAWAGGISAYVTWAGTFQYTAAARGTGTNIINYATCAGEEFQINAGHGFNRIHSNGLSFSPSVTQLQVEAGIAADAAVNKALIPTVGANGRLASGVKAYQGSTMVGSQKVGYRAVQQNGKISIGTYWPE